MSIPTNRALRQYLLDTAPLPDLEALFEKEMALRTRIPRGSSDGHFLWADRFRELGHSFEPIVKSEVDRFLEVKEPRPCKIRYVASLKDVARGGLPISSAYVGYLFFSMNPAWPPSLPQVATVLAGTACMFVIAAASRAGSHYHPFTKRVVLGLIADEERVPATMGHELAHAAQNRALVRVPFQGVLLSRAFLEGHACGVEAHIGRYVAALKNDVAYERFANDRRIGALSNTYRWLAKQTGAPAPAWLDLVPERDLFSPQHKDKRRLCSYCLGTAVFSLAELRHGDAVYAKTLQRPSIVFE